MPETTCPAYGYVIVPFGNTLSSLSKWTVIGVLGPSFPIKSYAIIPKI